MTVLRVLTLVAEMAEVTVVILVIVVTVVILVIVVTVVILVTIVKVVQVAVWYFMSSDLLNLETTNLCRYINASWILFKGFNQKFIASQVGQLRGVGGERKMGRGQRRKKYRVYVRERGKLPQLAVCL